MKTKQFALSTFDNPFNPFDDYKAWLSFDKEHCYDSSERLMRIANLTDDMTLLEEEVEKKRAIDEIIKNDILHVYIEVSRDLTLPDDAEKV